MSEPHIVKITVTGSGSSTAATPAAALAGARAALQAPGRRMAAALAAATGAYVEIASSET